MIFEFFRTIDSNAKIAIVPEDYTAFKVLLHCLRVYGDSPLALSGIIRRKNRYLIPPCEIQRAGKEGKRGSVLCPLEYNIVNSPFNCAREDPLLLLEPYRLTLLKPVVLLCISNLPHYGFSMSLKNRVVRRTNGRYSLEKNENYYTSRLIFRWLKLSVAF